MTNSQKIAIIFLVILVNTMRSLCGIFIKKKYYSFVYQYRKCLEPRGEGDLRRNCENQDNSKAVVT